MAEIVVPAEKRLYTLGQLVAEMEVNTHRLKYAIDQYGIKPVTRVGIIRVWSEDSIPEIKNALARIAQNRRGR